jgi:hypothetical protein
MNSVERLLALFSLPQHYETLILLFWLGLLAIAALILATLALVRGRRGWSHRLPFIRSAPDPRHHASWPGYTLPATPSEYRTRLLHQVLSGPSRHGKPRP